MIVKTENEKEDLETWWAKDEFVKQENGQLWRMIKPKGVSNEST